MLSSWKYGNNLKSVIGIFFSNQFFKSIFISSVYIFKVSNKASIIVFAFHVVSDHPYITNMFSLFYDTVIVHIQVLFYSQYEREVKSNGDNKWS